MNGKITRDEMIQRQLENHGKAMHDIREAQARKAQAEAQLLREVNGLPNELRAKYLRINWRALYRDFS